MNKGSTQHHSEIPSTFALPHGGLCGAIMHMWFHQSPVYSNALTTPLRSPVITHRNGSSTTASAVIAS